MLEKWYEFMETDPDIKDNPFARITILKAITEDLLPENSKTAVEFDRTLAKKIIADAMNDVDNVSFRKAYLSALKAQSQKGDKGEKIDFDGVRGTMYGQFNFIGSNLSDIRNLREINGIKINWE